MFYLKIFIYSLLLSYIYDTVTHKRFDLSKFNYKIFGVIFFAMIIFFNKDMFIMESFEDEPSLDIQELSDIYTKTTNEDLIEKNKLTKEDMMEIYENLKHICPKLINNHNINKTGGKIHDIQKESKLNNKEFTNKCPVLMMENIFGEKNVDDLLIESFDSEKCDLLELTSESQEETDIANIDLINQYISGMFFIYKNKCLMDAQNDEQLYKCGYNYLLGDLYNDKRFILLGSGVSKIQPSVYRKNFYCHMKNLFKNFFEHRVTQICKDNSVFNDTNACMREFNLVLAKKDYSNYLLKLFLSDREMSLVLKDKISSDTLTIVEFHKEIIENDKIMNVIANNITTDKSVKQIASLLKMEQSNVRDYLKNLDVMVDIIDSVKTTIKKDINNGFFDLLTGISDKLLGDIKKVDINIPIKDEKCDNVPGLVYCENDKKCFAPWKNTCKNMSIDSATKQIHKRANDLFNAMMESEETPTENDIDDLISSLDKKDNWKNGYKITKDMWLKDEGKCYFSGLKLVKNDDESYTLNWRRIDSDKEGIPKKFDSLEHFQKFWKFVNANVKSINNCKVEQPNIQEQINEMDRNRYSKSEIEETTQKGINEGDKNQTKQPKNSISDSDLRNKIENLEKKITKIELMLSNGRKMESNDYKKLVDKYKRVNVVKASMMEEYKKKIKKNNIKNKNFENQIELENVKKFEKENDVCPMYSQQNPRMFLNSDNWTNNDDAYLVASSNNGILKSNN
jgi:hypothetical protein